jgi:hypothetical protein
MSAVTRIRPDVAPVPFQGHTKDFLRGIQAAVDMLEHAEFDETLIWDYDNGPRSTPFRNRVHEALQRVLRRGDAGELEGFCAALSTICAEADDKGDYFLMLRRYIREYEPAPGARS